MQFKTLFVIYDMTALICLMIFYFVCRSKGYFLNSSDLFFEIIYPPELKYLYRLRAAKDFGAPFNESFLEKRIPLVQTDPPHGCQVAKNAKELKGRIALVERGGCSFFVKSIMAEEAGAKAVIISDYVEESISYIWINNYHYIYMTRDDNIPATKTVNIPAGFLRGRNGKMIRETLKRLNQPFALINIPVNLTYSRFDKKSIHARPILPYYY